MEETDIGLAFNLHFAPAFEYPEFYGIPPFSRIPVGQESELDRFRHREAPEWPIPLRRRIAEHVSLFCLIGALGLIAGGVRRSRPSGGDQ